MDIPASGHLNGRHTDPQLEQGHDCACRVLSGLPGDSTFGIVELPLSVLRKVCKQAKFDEIVGAFLMNCFKVEN